MPNLQANKSYTYSVWVKMVNDMPGKLGVRFRMSVYHVFTGTYVAITVNSSHAPEIHTATATTTAITATTATTATTTATTATATTTTTTATTATTTATTTSTATATTTAAATTTITIATFTFTSRD